MQASHSVARSLPGSLAGSQRSPPLARPRAAAWRLLHRAPAGVRCSSVAGDLSAEAPSTSGRPAAGQEDAGAPPSWPSAAAREAAYGRSPREPALQVPAEVSGRLPAWLNGTYVRNGPGDLADMVRVSWQGLGSQPEGAVCSVRVGHGAAAASGPPAPCRHCTPRHLPARPSACPRSICLTALASWSPSAWTEPPTAWPPRTGEGRGRGGGSGW